MTTPHPPCSNHFLTAVVSFESGGQVVALGNISRQSQGEDVKVAFTTKHRGIELPYLGFRVKLKLDPADRHLYQNFEFLTIFFKYHNDCFDCVHHTANEKEKEGFLGIMLNDVACKEVVISDKLYVIKLFKKENRGPEVTVYGIPCIRADAKINDTFNHLYSVHTCSVVTVWLVERNNLAFQVQWTLDYLQTAALKPCYNHLLTKTATEHELSVFTATSQNSAAHCVTEKPTDSFPTQMDKKDQDPVGRGAGAESAATTNVTKPRIPQLLLRGEVTTSSIWKRRALVFPQLQLWRKGVMTGS